VRPSNGAATVFASEYFIDIRLGKLFTPAHHYNNEIVLLSRAPNQPMPMPMYYAADDDDDDVARILS